MRINRSRKSPNFTSIKIPVEYLVLHYTGGPRDAALDILCSPERQVSAHLVLAEDGEVFELVPCLEEDALRAWHAGKSRWMEGSMPREGFNDFSIGIEMVNGNGNLLSYTDAQYEALSSLVTVLRARYPALNDPARVVGHEHIAGFRGKLDPGLKFDWPSFFARAYGGAIPPERKAQCDPPMLSVLEECYRRASETDKKSADFWFALSAKAEEHFRHLIK